MLFSLKLFRSQEFIFNPRATRVPYHFFMKTDEFRGCFRNEAVVNLWKGRGAHYVIFSEKPYYAQSR